MTIPPLRLEKAKGSNVCRQTLQDSKYRRLFTNSKARHSEAEVVICMVPHQGRFSRHGENDICLEQYKLPGAKRVHVLKRY